MKLILYICYYFGVFTVINRWYWGCRIMRRCSNKSTCTPQYIVRQCFLSFGVPHPNIYSNMKNIPGTPLVCLYLISLNSQNKSLSSKGSSHQIRPAWKRYGLIGLGGDMRRWTFKIFKGALRFLIGLWSSYVTHIKHLPSDFFLGSWQRLTLARLEFPLTAS